MYYGSTLIPVDGDPALVAQRSADYLQTANAILAAASDLLAVANRQETISIAVDQIRALAEQVNREITLAQSRYQAAALALNDFAPILAEAQSRANTAIDSYYPQQTQANELYNDFAYYVGEPGAEDDARTDWMAADARANGFRADYDAAVAELRDASDHAAERISVVIDQSDLNDSFWDNVSGLGEQLGQWFSEVFGPMIDGLLDVLGRIVQVLAIVVAAVLLLAVLNIVLLDALLFLRTGDVGARDEALALVVFAISPMLLSAWLTGRGTPTVTPFSTQGPQERLRDQLDNTPFRSAIQDQEEVDDAGAAGVLGDDSAVIQVTTVVGEDGVTRYRVQIPSTQQWFSPGGNAPNDLDGNLWAKFFPDQRSELEKGVELALLEAGYIPGSGSDIMLAGFSQGGIVAANLAADPAFTSRFDVQTVFTVGSPIGDVPIQEHISVISIEHIDDVMTDLDFMTENPQRDNWITISTTPANEDAAFLGHNVEDYGASAGREIDESRNPAIVSFRESQYGFFYGSETVSQFEVRRG